MVLAHEIAHARQRDPLLGTGRGMLIGLLISSLSGSGGSPASLGDLGSQLTLNLYSREQEQTADRLALEAVFDVYGHVGGATSLFEVIDTQEETAESLEVLATHPKLTDRIEYLTAMATEQVWQQLPGKPYPAHIDEALRKP